MANDSLADRALDALAHLCVLAALALGVRTARGANGWLRVPTLTEPPPLPALSVIVPARNEERSIARCVQSLLAQRNVDVELIVVDDRSQDRTRTILAALAAEYPALRVVDGAPLPDGWVGKPWALVQGARVAHNPWLLFTDADTWHAPDACASTLAFALAHGADALTLGTYQELGSWGERAVLPTMLGLILIATGSMAELNDPYDCEHALANGQYVLVSRQAYDHLGGHEAVRGELVEDVEFARRLKRDGRYRLLVAGAGKLVRVRMYHSLHELWNGFTKNVYAGARGDLRTLLGMAASLALVSVVPAALALEAVVRRRPCRAAEAVLALGMGMAAQARGSAAAGLPRRWALLAPVGYGVCAAVVLNSTWRVRSGRGVEWRGRRYTGDVA